MSESQTDLRTVLVPSRPISPPLAPWQVFVLTFFTFSFYSSFWLYRSALDISRLDREKRYPVLWFLSPLIGITLPGSIPRLLERYDVVLGKTHWTTKAMPIAVLAFVAMVPLNLSGRIEISFWLLIVPLALYWHWITLLLSGILLALIAYAVIDERLTSGPGEPVPANSRFQIPDSNMILQFGEPDWVRINRGTYSNGTASVELKGPTDYQWLIVFDQGENVDMDDWIQTRRETAEDPDNEGLSCTDEVLTAANGVDLIADVTCTG